MNKKQKKMLIRIAITAVMLIALAFLPLTGIWRLLAYVAAYLVIGYDILRKAGIGIIHGRAFDECFLMAIATLGELFQSYAVGKSRRNISALMDIRPDYANIERTASSSRSTRMRSPSAASSSCSPAKRSRWTALSSAAIPP